MGSEPVTGLRRAATTLVTLVAAGVVVAPLLVMAWTVRAEGAGRLDDMLRAPGLGAAVGATIGLAVVVTVLAVPVGTVLALTLRHHDLPGRSFWQVAVLLPVLVPDYVLGYSWLRAYGRAGFLDDVLGVHWEGVQGPAGVAVVLAVNAVPLAYLVVLVGLAAGAEPSTERAARASGAGPLTVLRTVTLPLLGPALATAAVLVLVLTLGTFAIPQVMGSPAGFSTVTTRIYADLTRSSDPFAFVEAVALALLLVVLAALVVTPADRLLGQRLRVTRVGAIDPGATVPHGAAGPWAAAGVAGYLLLTLALPLLALLSAAAARAAGLPIAPSSWSLANVEAVLTVRNGEALGRSVALAALAATVLVVLGGCVAALERGPAGRGLATLVTLTLVLPGSTLAVGLLITYGRWLSGGLAIILLAYVAKLWAFAHRPISGALDRRPPDELRAARAGGASLLTAIRSVALRPLLPALLAAWSVCFLTALHEVTMSSLLYGPGGETLAVVVLNSQELGQVGVTSALSLVLSVLLGVPTLLLWWAIRRLDRDRRPRSRQVLGAA